MLTIYWRYPINRQPINYRSIRFFIYFFTFFSITSAFAEDVSIIFLGDIHYDKPEHHELSNETNNPVENRMFGYYSRITSQNLSPLMESVRSVITQADIPASLIVQSGDFVDGLCGNSKLTRLQFEDFTSYIDSLKFNIPFCVIEGNHDISGPGAEKAYKKVISPWIKQQIGIKPKLGCYSFSKGDILFLFYNSYDNKSLDWLEKTIKKSDKQRFVVICHKPVVPFQARSNWILFSGESEKDKRTRLLNILGNAHAIVLSGHLHDFGLVVRKTDTGSFVQLSISSVFARTRNSSSNYITGIENYTGSLAELEPYFSRSTLEERKQILEAEKPFVTHFEFANNYGYANIVFKDDAIIANIYEGIESEVWRTFDLLSLMNAK